MAVKPEDGKPNEATDERQKKTHKTKKANLRKWSDKELEVIAELREKATPITVNPKTHQRTWD